MIGINVPLKGTKSEMKYPSPLFPLTEIFSGMEEGIR
jgi:hypothetical protein